MDIATIVGLVLGIGLVGSSIAMGGGGLMPFVDPPSLMITVCGSISAILITFPMQNCLAMFKVVMNCFMTKIPGTGEVIEQFKEFATVARRDGLVALESSMENIKDPFMKRGLESVVGGAEREVLEAQMEMEINYIDERHKSGKKMVDTMAAAAPAFGMIGTLIGLVQMLRTLDDPSKIGGGMATALLTTLYGAVIANMFCIPLAGKLEARNSEEVMVRELIMVGMIALIEGQTPRVMEERLSAFLANSVREAMAKKS